MPQHYKRKTDRATRIPADVLQRAADEVQQGTSILKAAVSFNIDKMTLSRYIAKCKTQPQPSVGYAAVTLANYIIPTDMESDLAKHIITLADMFHGFSLKKCKELAYEFGLRNKLKLPSSWVKNKKAGKNWWLGFKALHKLSIRLPKPTSVGRASAFNKHTVKEYFDNLAKVMDDNKFTAEQIFNVDETGVTTVQNPKHVITAKGTRNVGSITSGERGELVTAVYTIGASGSVLPPMLIFPRVHFRDHLIKGGPQSCIGQCNRSGWINENLFLVCGPKHKILLILDNHESHISLDVIDKAKSAGIVMLTIPPHTSHQLQPLDKSVFGPFKASYCRAMDNWMRSNPGKNVTIYEIPALVKKSSTCCNDSKNILSGFECTGTWPYNREIFTELDFAPAAVTDCLLSTDTEIQSNEFQQQSQIAKPYSSSQICSSTPNFSKHSAAPTPEVDQYVSSREIHDIPKAAPRKATNSRKRKTTRILTATPVRDSIAVLKTQKKNIYIFQTKKAKKKLFGKKKATKLVTESSSEEENIEIHYDDNSDFLTDENIVEGDYVIVNVRGRSIVVQYIARVDEVNGNESEGVFLQKLSGCIIHHETITFIVNENDCASFVSDDVVFKLPLPNVICGTSRRANQLRFNCDFTKWNLSH